VKSLLLIAALCFGVLSAGDAQLLSAGDAQPRTCFNSIVVRPLSTGPLDQHLINFDSTFAWAEGDIPDSGGRPIPGLFVYSKTSDRWFQIEQVSTVGADFGNSPPEAGLQPPWDLTHFASTNFVALPIPGLGRMYSPHKITFEVSSKITFDETRDAYVLLFDCRWNPESNKSESTRTTLLIPKKDLMEAFDYYSGHKSHAASFNPRGGANGRQPPSSDTNPASATAGSRRSSLALLQADAVDEPLIPALLNDVLAEIEPGMTTNQVVALLGVSYPKVGVRIRDLSMTLGTGKTDIVYKLDERFMLWVRSMMRDGEELVHTNRYFDVFDRQTKRCVHLSLTQAEAAGEPLIAGPLNAVLPKIQPGMTTNQVVSVLRASYPKIEDMVVHYPRQPDKRGWLGSSWMNYNLDGRLRLMVEMGARMVTDPEERVYGGQLTFGIVDSYPNRNVSINVWYVPKGSGALEGGVKGGQPWPAD
jgi:hypothetical protein